MKKTVFLTGATGLMGWQGLQELLSYPDAYKVVVLARKSRKNEKKLAPVMDKIKVVWGDLMNYEDVLEGVSGADYVLHVGGMVSPAADYYPEKTMKVNITAAKNIVDAILAQPDPQKVKAVYIGTVAQTSEHLVPKHWGRIGDPIAPSIDDYYGLSKATAERIFANSGLPNWVSLRQSGILYAGILKNFDPIMFHVPIKGVIEWSTVEDSGRLLERICRDDVPQNFWNHFYNVSSGPQYRMSNYEFECRVLKASSCPPPEKIFRPKWFVLKNFHGQFYLDSQKLEDFLHFRANVPIDEYFHHLSTQIPGFFKLAKIVPPFIMRKVLEKLANRPTNGTQYWIKNNCKREIDAYFGGMDKYNSIPDWSGIDLSTPPGEEEAIRISHGYDENVAINNLKINDLRMAAEFRGGTLLSDSYSGNPDEKLLWQCHKGHTFEATVKLILEGGHWCTECLSPKWEYQDLAENSPFFAQIYTP